MQNTSHRLSLPPGFAITSKVSAKQRLSAEISQRTCRLSGDFYHADILLCQLGLWENGSVFHGDPEKLTRNYPGNIRYNAVCTGKYFTIISSTRIRICWQQRKQRQQPISTILTKIHVKQGYTRCSLLPVDDRSFITSDAGIAKTLADHDTDVLLIHRGMYTCRDLTTDHRRHRRRPPLSGRRLLVVNGNIKTHPDHKKIATFLEDRDIDLYYSKDSPLMDIGSILVDAAPKPLQQPAQD